MGLRYRAAVEWFPDDAPGAGIIRVWPAGAGPGDRYVWVCTLIRKPNATAYLAGFIAAPTIGMCRALTRCLRGEGFAAWSRNKVMAADGALHLRRYLL